MCTFRDLLLSNFFSHCSIDATHASKSRMGRMVNDSDIPSEKNSKMRKIIVKGTMHLALFATKEINIGDEILYDYGDENSWWRKVISL